VGEDVLVFTKCGRRWEGRPEGVIENDLRPESIREECERSLRRLGLERIDLYQFHWPDWMTGTALEDSWGTMIELVEEGKARWIGVANFDAEQLDRCEAIRHVDSVQPPLSLLARGARHTVSTVGGRAWNGRHRATRPWHPACSRARSTGAESRARRETDWRASSPAFKEPAAVADAVLVERLRPIASGSTSRCPTSSSPGSSPSPA
jgi:aryl-alcohol dehydrogenase-like predicted oxidoreductase